jgi:hypothetical protein
MKVSAASARGLILTTKKNDGGHPASKKREPRFLGPLF